MAASKRLNAAARLSLHGSRCLTHERTNDCSSQNVAVVTCERHASDMRAACERHASGMLQTRAADGLAEHGKPQTGKSLVGMGDVE